MPFNCLKSDCFLLLPTSTRICVAAGTAHGLSGRRCFVVLPCCSHSLQIRAGSVTQRKGRAPERRETPRVFTSCQSLEAIIPAQHRISHSLFAQCNLQRYLHRKFAFATVVKYNKQNEAHHHFGYYTLYWRIPSKRSNKGKDEYIIFFWLLTGDNWPSAPDGMFTLWCLYWNIFPVATRGQHLHVIYKTVTEKYN